MRAIERHPGIQREAAESPLDHLSRNDRRLLLRSEERDRRSGHWGPWETLHFPRGTVGSGWTAAFMTAHRNKVFSVLDRDAGEARHLAITSLSQIRPTWWEMQRIKDELAGEDATAVEIYPPLAEVVDDAPMYHLWVLGAPLPFGLWSRAEAPPRPVRGARP